MVTFDWSFSKEKCKKKKTFLISSSTFFFDGGAEAFAVNKAVVWNLPKFFYNQI